MWSVRAARLLSLAFFVAGPFGFLAAEHAALHVPDCHDGHDPVAPKTCPLCHVHDTVAADAPPPAFRLPAPAPLDVVSGWTVPVPPSVAPLHVSGPRAPPPLS
jgi:hypothetical protein